MSTSDIVENFAKIDHKLKMFYHHIRNGKSQIFNCLLEFKII